MGFSFKHAAVTPETTRRFDLGISTSPASPSVVLIVKHAGESNAGYWNAMFKRLNISQTQAAASGAKLSPEKLVSARNETVEVFARHVVIGWENVIEDGKPAECTPDAALRLLSALIDPLDGRPDVFAELRAYCETAANFTAPTVSAVDLGKK